MQVPLQNRGEKINMSRRFRVSKKLRTRLEEAGIAVAPVLRAAGLPRDFFDQDRTLVNTLELFSLWRAIGELGKDPALGLRLGSETNSAKFHPSGIAALSADTFGACVACMARYKKLSAPEEILQTIDETEWTIRFRWTLAVDHEPPVLVEYCFASLLSLARCGTASRISPLRVELVQERKHVKQLERHFGCPVLCGAAYNAMIFRARDREASFVTRNAELLAMLAPQFEQELKQNSAGEEDSFIELVRGIIQRRLTGKRPTIEEIASDLNMSLRTLQRRLQETGWNYQRVLEDARRQLARYYLSNSVLELGEAAYLLGYEDANSFARAFRIWEGIPPALWRENHRQAQIPSII